METAESIEPPATKDEIIEEDTVMEIAAEERDRELEPMDAEEDADETADHRDDDMDAGAPQDDAQREEDRDERMGLALAEQMRAQYT